MRTIKEIVDQLEKCQYKDDLGHDLNDNIAFARLKDLSGFGYQPKFAINEPVVYNGEQMYVFAMRCAMSSHPDAEMEYMLSVECNRPSTTNEGALGWINENSLLSKKDNGNRIISNAISLLISEGYDVKKRI